MEVRQLRADRHARCAGAPDDLVERLGEELVHRVRSTPSTRPSSRPSTTETGTSVAEGRTLTASSTGSPVLAGPRSVGGPAGRADQPQPARDDERQGTTSSGSAQGDAGLLGIDRDAEHANTASRRGGRGRRRRSSTTGPTSACWCIELPAGHGAHQRDIGDPAVLAARRRRRTPAAGRAAVHRRLRHVRAAGGGTCDLVARARLPPARDYDDHAPPWERVRRALAATAGAHGPVQQRPAGRQLHRRRRPGLADRLRVLRQQRPVLRARQHRHRVRLRPRADRRLVDGLLRATTTRPSGPGCGSRRCARVRLVAVGLHPGRDQPARLRLPRLGRWSGSRRRPRHFARPPAFDRLLERGGG